MLNTGLHVAAKKLGKKAASASMSLEEYIANTRRARLWRSGRSGRSSGAKTLVRAPQKNTGAPGNGSQKEPKKVPNRPY